MGTCVQGHMVIREHMYKGTWLTCYQGTWVQGKWLYGNMGTREHKFKGTSVNVNIDKRKWLHWNTVSRKHGYK